MIERMHFTPPWLEKGKKNERPVFSLRAGSIIERDQFEAELEGRHRAGAVLSFQLLEAAIEGIRALISGEDADALVEMLRADHGGEPLAPADKAKVKRAGDILAQHWPEYGALVEQEARRNAILPTLAFRTFCDGWENVKDDAGEPAEYARDALGEMSDELLRRVGYGLVRSAGLEAYRIQYGRTQAKN